MEMTYHSTYDKKCGCGWAYIPYVDGIACPMCGAKGETYDIISEVIKAGEEHFAQHGCLLPTYSITSVGDQYIMMGLKKVSDPKFIMKYRTDSQMMHWERFYLLLMNKVQEECANEEAEAEAKECGKAAEAAPVDAPQAV